ncbi:hypothetical protein PR048_032933 [Dryococelus australis]|uniref:Integrase catalytic domain-containing protein n=1 Tax=Dryococelus australis TaxID=614101 RepID=A0ABQ9G6G5_9NEOP|nr:hypothetical protein PR048_032933 [Dryococelus australis]
MQIDELICLIAALRQTQSLPVADDVVDSGAMPRPILDETPGPLNTTSFGFMAAGRRRAYTPTPSMGAEPRVADSNQDWTVHNGSNQTVESRELIGRLRPSSATPPPNEAITSVATWLLFVFASVISRCKTVSTFHCPRRGSHGITTRNANCNLFPSSGSDTQAPRTQVRLTECELQSVPVFRQRHTGSENTGATDVLYDGCGGTPTKGGIRQPNGLHSLLSVSRRISQCAERGRKNWSRTRMAFLRKLWRVRSRLVFYNMYCDSASNLIAIEALALKIPLHEVLLSQVVLERLDEQGRKEWEVSSSSNQVFTIKEFITSLHREAKSLLVEDQEKSSQKSCGRERGASEDDDDNRRSSAQYCPLNVKQHINILLPTATVRVHYNTGMLHTCRALLDSYSQAHFVSESLVQRLALKKFPYCVPLQWINTVRAEAKYGATVQILSMITNYSATLDFAILPRISIKTTNGKSLNDILKVGPTIQQDLCSIMLWFRSHKVCFTADIEKMYHQIRVDPKDCHLQQILWRKSPDKVKKVYELQTVMYGKECASFLATRALHQLTLEEKKHFPVGSELPQVNGIHIDIHIFSKGIIVDVQLHGFANASERGYGACMYTRSTEEPGKVTVKLLCAKSKVAPVEMVSLSLLELCGALLLSRLFKRLSLVDWTILVARRLNYVASSKNSKMLSSNASELPVSESEVSVYSAEDKILHVGECLQHEVLQLDQKHQMILPLKHQLTRLIIEEEHRHFLHAGGQLLLSSLHQHYWIVNGKDIIRRIIHNCIVCFRLKATSAQQLMATNAVHLEVVSELTSQAFIAALKRFVSRRGRVSQIYSDNGSNFVRANMDLHELKLLFETTDHQAGVNAFTPQKGIQCHFIPPRAPHFGGLWEAGIKSFKYHLRRQSNKWTTETSKIQSGNLAILRQDGLPPLMWKIGIIQQAHPGPDELTRVVTIRTTQGTVKWSITKLCPLPSRKWRGETGQLNGLNSLLPGSVPRWISQCVERGRKNWSRTRMVFLRKLCRVERGSELRNPEWPGQIRKLHQQPMEACQQPSLNFFTLKSIFRAPLIVKESTSPPPGTTIMIAHDSRLAWEADRPYSF